MRTFKVNKKYTHFAVSNATGKIIDAWEYKGLDKESIKYYTDMDLKANDHNPKDFKIIQKDKLIKKGINPMDWANWGNNFNK